MDLVALGSIVAVQRGVISRAQLLAIGATDHDIRRLVRRRQWARLHSGVFVDHTGPPTWEQRAWAAVLAHAPAALAGDSALHAHGVRGVLSAPANGPIRVCIDADRFVRPISGIRVERIKDFAARCQLNTSPPRLRLEYAALSEAARKHRPASALALLADCVQQGKTTPPRLVDALDDLPRLRRRALLHDVLADVASGAYSVLEHRYLVEVERPHGLPTGSRQRRVRPGRTVAYRDVDYLGLRTCVELDGRLGHEAATDRWDDLDRDLDAVASGDLTLRVAWGQVLEPCRLASVVGSVLVARGWSGATRPCGSGCWVSDHAA
jgi:hypothetical protein